MSEYLTTAEIRAEYKRFKFTLDQALQEIEIALDYWNRCLEFYGLSNVDSLPSNFMSRYSKDERWEILKADKEKKFLTEFQFELNKLKVQNGSALPISQDIFAPPEHAKAFREGMEANHLEGIGHGKYLVLTSLQKYFAMLTAEYPESELTASFFYEKLLNRKNHNKEYSYKSIETELQKARN